jgi:hypothetical protein
MKTPTWDINVSPISIVTSIGGTESYEVSDIEYTRFTEAETYTTGKLVLPSLEGSYTITVTALTPSIATVDNAGNIAYVSDGIAKFKVQSTLPGWCNKIISIQVSHTLSSFDLITDFSTQYGGKPVLGYAVRHNILSRLTGKQKNMFTTGTTRNTNFWGADLDWSCYSPWNSDAGRMEAGTLVSPSYYIQANHFTTPNGSKIHFVGMDNTVQERTVVSSVNIYKQGETYNDIRLGKLDSPVDFKIAKILPANWQTYLPHLNNLLLAVCCNQEKSPLIHPLIRYEQGSYWRLTFDYTGPGTEAWKYNACDYGTVDGEVVTIDRDTKIVTGNHFINTGTGYRNLFLWDNKGNMQWCTVDHIISDTTLLLKDIPYFLGPYNYMFMGIYNWIPGVRVGDSGSPAFMIVGSDLVLLSCWHGGYGGIGPCLSTYIDEINDAMDGEQLSIVDLSSYAMF